MTPQETLLTVIRHFIPLTPAEGALLTQLYVTEEVAKGAFFCARAR
jgi:hypothetical protein